MLEYDLIADWYATQRDHQTGLPEVNALAHSLPRGSLLLDIGCGNGIPITRALLDAGHRAIGLDSSTAMLEQFRLNFPSTAAVKGEIQSCPFADSTFDGAVAWGVLFHLDPDNQVRAIASVSRVLKSGAPFLFTAGAIDGFQAKEGTMNGIVFRYYSYSPENYRRILTDHGLTLTDVHTDPGDNTCYLAMKS